MPEWTNRTKWVVFLFVLNAAVSSLNVYYSTKVYTDFPENCYDSSIIISDMCLVNVTDEDPKNVLAKAEGSIVFSSVVTFFSVLIPLVLLVCNPQLNTTSNSRMQMLM